MNTLMNTQFSITLPPWTHPLMLSFLTKSHTSREILQRIPSEEFLTVYFLGFYQVVHRYFGSFGGKINKGKHLFFIWEITFISQKGNV